MENIFKRGTTLTIPPTEELVINEANIRQSLAKVIQREKDRGNEIKVGIDYGVWSGVFKNVTMPKIIKSFTSVIHRFTQVVSHRQIREEADKVSVKKDWNIAEAWNIIIAGILAGEVDIKGIGIFAYTKIESEYTSFRLEAQRGNDNKLRITIFWTHFDEEFDTGYGISLLEN